MDLVIDKFDDNLKLREFAARHHIPAVSDISSPKLKYLVTERNEQFLFKDLRRKKAHFFSLDLKPMNIDKIFKNTSSPIPASDDPYIFEKKEFSLPKQYTFEGEELSLSDGLAHFHTDGLIVLHNGNMLYENYWNGNAIDSKHISFSVAKSYLSALIGIAVEEGLIDNIDDEVSKYLNDFKNTGYEKVTIKNLLQMSSGIEFNEDYLDPNSDINKFGRATAR